ncbi:AAA family ATPase [Streptomyces sp. FR-108]|uniref:AAA family ATPase n=1 Tax=Streptomyces sp. FR-108 TaxID=3416665 RepID=UPI003CF4903A
MSFAEIDETKYCTYKDCTYTEPTHDGNLLGHPFKPPGSSHLASVVDFPHGDESSYEDESVRREIRLTPASKVRVRRVKWLWDTTTDGAPPTSEGRIPMSALTIAAGGPGIGKSQYAIWLTAQITQGVLPGELFGKPRTVIYAATEDSWSMTIVPRLIAAGADLDRVFHVDVTDDEDLHARLTLPTDISLLGKTCDTYGVALFVADPLLSLLSETINDYRAKEVRSALEPLVKLSEQHGFTILGLAHFTKNGSADPLSRIAGSGAFGQLVRAAIAFSRVEDAPDDEDRFVLSQIKNNLGRHFVPSFEYQIIPVTVEAEDGEAHVSKFVLGSQADTSVLDQMRSADRGPGDAATAREAADWLLDYLSDSRRGGEATPKAIFAAGKDEASLTENALREAKKLLKVKSVKPAQKDAPWVWQLPA